MHELLRMGTLIVASAIIYGCGDGNPSAPPSQIVAPSIQVAASAQGSAASYAATPAKSTMTTAPLDAKLLALCAAEANSVKRLACFDEVAKANGLAPANNDTSTTTSGKWLTRTDTDPLTDKAVHYASLKADNGTGRFGDRVTMTIRCKGTRTEAFINWNTFLGSDGLTVTTRIDKSAAVTSYWELSTDHKASFMPQSVTTLKKFEGAAIFVANLTPYSESPITAVFDISSSNEAFKEIRRDCKW